MSITSPNITRIISYLYKTHILTKYSRKHSIARQKAVLLVFCEGNSPMTGGFPSQRANNEENVSIWWRHHCLICTQHLSMTRYVWYRVIEDRAMWSLHCINHWNPLITAAPHVKWYTVPHTYLKMLKYIIIECKVSPHKPMLYSQNLRSCMKKKVHAREMHGTLDDFIFILTTSPSMS